MSVDPSREAVKHAPAYDPDALPNREQENRMYEHYARPGYWAGHTKLEIEPARRKVSVAREVPASSAGTKARQL